jgi:hypothetical protein
MQRALPSRADALTALLMTVPFLTFGIFAVLSLCIEVFGSSEEGSLLAHPDVTRDRTSFLIAELWNVMTRPVARIH